MRMIPSRSDTYSVDGTICKSWDHTMRRMSMGPCGRFNAHKIGYFSTTSKSPAALAHMAFPCLSFGIPYIFDFTSPISRGGVAPEPYQIPVPRSYAFLRDRQLWTFLRSP